MGCSLFVLLLESRLVKLCCTGPLFRLADLPATVQCRMTKLNHEGFAGRKAFMGPRRDCEEFVSEHFLLNEYA